MAHYIDADLLRKEIDFAKSVYDNPKRVITGVADAFRQDGRAAMCDDILKKIDSLQQEQPSLPSDLDKAARKSAVAPFNFELDEEHLYEYPYLPIAEQKFKEGAKWQKEQMMSEAVEGVLVATAIGHLRIEAETDGKNGMKHGDKVRIIVCKKED